MLHSFTRLTHILFKLIIQHTHTKHTVRERERESLKCWKVRNKQSALAKKSNSSKRNRPKKKKKRKKLKKEKTAKTKAKQRMM